MLHASDDGDFTFTRVTQNTIVTAGSMLKIGIGQGPSVWWKQDKRQICHGATVSRNLITRDTGRITHPSSSSYSSDLGPLGAGTIGYGFPVGSDIIDWTCVDNVSEDDVRYEGDISSTLPRFLNAAPGPFIHDRFGDSEGDEVDLSRVHLQPEFVQGKVWGLLDIKEGPSKIIAYDGGSLKLRRGERLYLDGAQVVFGHDLELRINKMEGGYETVLWEAGIRRMIDPGHPGVETAILHFTSGGKLSVVDEENPFRVLLDLTPHVPANLPPSPSNRPTSPRLVFSNEQPYVTITSETGNLVYGSSYTVGRFSEFPIGKYVARSTPHEPFNGGALIYSLSPQLQFGVAHTRVELPPKLEWPLDFSVYDVLSVTGPEDSGADDPNAKLSLQGDGHLV